jgi:hypothetical protein
MLALLSFFGVSVFQFDDNAFTQHIRRGNKSIPWFVMFGGANCPACTVAYPEFESASNRARGFARFAYADRSVAPNAAESLSIRTIPAFWLFAESGDRLFTGAPTSTGFLRFISEVIGEGVEDADESWTDRADRSVILFTRQFKPPALFAAACGAFRGRGISFGMARDSDTLEAYGNPPLPSIWFYKDGEKQMYKGKHEFIALIDTISEYFAIETEDAEL